MVAATVFYKKSVLVAPGGAAAGNMYITAVRDKHSQQLWSQRNSRRRGPVFSLRYVTKTGSILICTPVPAVAVPFTHSFS